MRSYVRHAQGRAAGQTVGGERATLPNLKRREGGEGEQPTLCLSSPHTQGKCRFKVHSWCLHVYTLIPRAVIVIAYINHCYSSDLQESVMAAETKQTCYEGSSVDSFQFYLKHSGEHEAMLQSVHNILPGLMKRYKRETQEVQLVVMSAHCCDFVPRLNRWFGCLLYVCVLQSGDRESFAFFILGNTPQIGRLFLRLGPQN